MKLARIQATDYEPTWHVQCAVIIAMLLQFLLSDSFSIGHRTLVFYSEIILLLALSIPNLSQAMTKFKRFIAFVFIAIISLSNIASLILVTRALVSGGQAHGTELLLSALAIYATNIIIFGLLYWELDGTTIHKKTDVTDFLFPQMANNTSATKQHAWNATFFDYLYISITNATAFSPTDTLPLTHRAKLLMSIQSVVSLATIALVAARAVNILT